MEKTKTILRTLKYVALLVIFAFCLPVFSACGEENIPVTSLNFVQNNYTIKQGDTIQLAVKLMPLEATNKIVRYSLPVGDTEADKHVTLNSETGLLEAKVIDDKKTVTVEVLAKSDYGNFTDTCFVTIVGEVQTLQAPTGLTYDDKTSSLTWNSVTAKDNFVTYNPKYCLHIKKDGEELSSQVLGTTNFKVTEAGKYEVTVQSVVTEDDYTTLYENSAESDSYSFEILPNVSEAKVVGNKITATTTGRADADYELQVFKTSFQGTKTIRGEQIDIAEFLEEKNQSSISWFIPETFEAGTYEFEIITKGNEELKLFDSREFAPVSFEKLSAPTDVLFSDETLSWKKVSSAKKYKIFVWSKATTSSPTPYLIKEITEGYTEENGRFSIDISQQEIKVSPYTIKIQSIGNGAEILDSIVQNIEIEKLATPTNLKIEGNTLSWSPVKNATSYAVYVNGRNPDTNNPENSNYKTPKIVSSSGSNTLTLDCSSMSFVADGEFTDAQNVNVITVVARVSYYDENNQLVTVESVAPAKLEVHKIEKVTLKNSFGDVGWDSIDDATGYHIVISKDGTTLVNENLPKEQLTYSFSNNDKTKEAGNYVVTVRGLGDGFKIRDGDEIVVNDSNKDSYTFVKQSAPIIKSFDSSGVLKWEAGEFSLDTTYYEISVYDTNIQGVVETFNQTGNSCDLFEYLTSYVGYAQYRFYVNATNDVSSLKYLNSEKSNIVTPYKLATPQNLRIENGKFVWDASTNVESSFESLLDYEILIGGKNKIQVGSYGSDGLVYEPTDTQMSAGSTSAVSVKTLVKQNSESDSPNKVTLSDGQTVYLLDSSYSVAQNFSRLTRPGSPSLDKDSSSPNFQRIVGKTILNALNYEIYLTYYGSSEIVVGTTTVDCQSGASQWCIEASLLFNQGLSAGKYRATVKALGESNYINSPISISGADLYKLATPELKLVNGVLCWNQVSSEINGVNTAVEKYTIRYRNTNTGNFVTQTIEGTSWDMGGIAPADYGISITAIGSGGAVVSSETSVEKVCTKLGKADASSMKIYTLSTTANEENYNTVVWDSVAQAQYRVKIYQASGSEDLKYNKVQQLASFTFDDSFSSSEYTIQIQTVNEGDYINGDISDKVKIRRLNTVQGIGISGTSSVVQETSSGKKLVDKNYKLTWDKVDGASAYTVLVKQQTGGSTALRTITSEDETSMYLIDSSAQKGTLGNLTGQLTITIVAKISGDELEQKDGVLTISSATSNGQKIYRNITPTINMQNGKITWTNNNSQDNGYTLVFSPLSPQATTVFVEIGRGVRSYDMSSTELADISTTYYTLSIIAVGTTDYYIQSNAQVFMGQAPVKVGKLRSVTDIKIVDGAVQWTPSENAQSYKTVATSGISSRQTYEGITKEGDSNVIKLPSSALSNLEGNISFTIQAIGSTSFSGSEECVYVNSIVSSLSTFNVTKLQKPTEICVKDGEVEWYRDLTENKGVFNVSGYKVEYQEGTATKSVVIGRETPFYVSDYIGKRTSLTIKVCAMGTENGGNGDFVSSDYSNSLNVVICGMPQNLSVSNGKLVWKEYDSDSYSYNDYEIEITFNDNSTKTIKSSTNSNTLATVTDLSHEFKSIRVRHCGTANSEEQQSISYVNSKYSAPLKNVIKLDEINDLEIEDSGVISWGSDYAYEKAGIVLSVGNTTTEFPTERKNININSDEIEEKIEKNGFAELTVSYYAYVPNNTRYEDDTSTPLYLYSESKTFSAIKFAPVASCKLSEDGLQLSWEMNLTTIRTNNTSVTNDKIVLVYQQSEYLTGEGNVDSVTEKTKEILISDANKTNIDGKSYYNIPLWDLGYYNFSVYVVTSNTNVEALRSASFNLEHQLFNKFSGGNGTAENPFVIESTENASQSQDPSHAMWTKHRSSALTKFNYIKTIPNCFFRLEEDVELETKTETNALVNNFSLGSAFSVPFTGGIDGMGADGTIHTIKNFQIYNGYSLFNVIEGGANKNALGKTANASNFYAQRGVLMNLNIEVSKFSYGSSATSENSLYLSIVARKMIGGLLANCQVNLNKDVYPDVVSITDYGTQTIVFGTFVAQLYGTEEYQSGNTVSSKNSYRNTTITNCTSNFGISILKSSGQSSRLTKVAGIVGECYGANIYNCTNNATLSANQVAGIVLKTASISTYEQTTTIYFEQQNVSSVISGCSNKAQLNAYTVNNNGKEDHSYSGGIVGEAINTFVANCLNSGDISISTIESYLKISASSDQSVAVVGGIVGTQNAGMIPDSTDKYNGGIINCINIGELKFTKTSFTFNGDIAEGPSYIGAILGTTDKESNIPKNSYYDLSKNPTNRMISGVGNSSATLQDQAKDKSFLTSQSSMSAEGVMATELVVADFLSGNTTSISLSFYSTLYLQKAQFTFADGSYPTLVQNVVVQ